MEDGAGLYLDLMVRVLANTIYEDPADGANPWYPDKSYDADVRSDGKDWPATAHTMIGLKRLANIRECVERVLADGVPGDLAEAGVWRGGACIYMRAILKAHGIADRRVWVVDSFEGLPNVGDHGHEGDKEIALHLYNDVLGVSLPEVKRNFDRYGLLDDQVRFLPGWFKDTLPSAPIDQIAVLRMDGDLYESTMDTLVNLYPKLAVGGYVIVDDYLPSPPCREAVDEFRAKYELEEPMAQIDRDGVYWRRMS